jgi:hypothetical protein
MPNSVTPPTSGFSVIEAMLASSLMALGLAASVRLSMVSLSANQAIQNLDRASALAQNLGECWGVQTPVCLQQFESTSELRPLSNPTPNTWRLTWEVSDVLISGAPSGSLQELRIKITWPEGDQMAELVWVKRRASTPSWVGS